MGFLTLSSIVATAALLPASLAVVAYKRQVSFLAYVFAHAAVAGFAVALAASPPPAAHTTGMLGKRPDGHISLAGLALWWPYHWGLRTKLFVQRHISSEPPWNQITPHWCTLYSADDVMYLGSWVGARQPLPEDVGAILDLTCELPLQAKYKSVPYFNIPTWDTYAPTVPQIEEGIQWALAQKAAGRPVYVHCAHGHGRSNVMLCALLVAEGTAATFEDAHNIVQRARPKAKLNARQRKALSEWVRWRAQRGKSM